MTVLVVGAGLGGLACANVLHRHGTTPVVVDLDASPTARPQGGMLDMHVESGQEALRRAGLYDAFLARVLPGGDATRVVDRSGTLRHQDAGRGERPEIDRNDLRSLLLDGLPPGTVRWGTKVTAVEPGRVVLADGTVETADVIVGADGAWSRVRPLLSAARPAYAGVSFVEFDVHAPDTVGPGMLFALGGRNGLLAHHESDGSDHVYAAVTAPEDWLDGIDFTDGPGAKDALLAEFADWSDGLRALISDAVGPLVPRRIHALPVGHRWDPVPGVTLLGDAAHLMSPFAGEGANLALLDGAELGEALARLPVEEALRSYEDRMFARSAEAAAQSAEGMAMCLADDAPDGLVAMFSG